MGLLSVVENLVEDALPAVVGVAAGFCGGPEAGISAFQAANAFEGRLGGQSKSSSEGSASSSQCPHNGVGTLFENPRTQEQLAAPQRTGWNSLTRDRFHGEGHHSIRTRLHDSQNMVNDLLPPHRPLPVADGGHSVTIVRNHRGERDNVTVVRDHRDEGDNVTVVRDHRGGGDVTVVGDPSTGGGGGGTDHQYTTKTDHCLPTCFR